AGADSVDGDLVGVQLDGQRAHQAEHAVLGGGVGGDVLRADLRGDGSDGDDAPVLLLDHWLDEGLGNKVDAGEVDRQHAVPELVRVVDKLGAAGVACVVDEDIEASPGAEHAAG